MKIVELPNITLYQLGESLMAASTTEPGNQFWSFWWILDGDLTQTLENMDVVYPRELTLERNLEEDFDLASDVHDDQALAMMKDVLTHSAQEALDHDYMREWPEENGVYHGVVSEYSNVITSKPLPDGMVGITEALTMVDRMLPTKMYKPKRTEPKRWKGCLHKLNAGRNKGELCGRSTYGDTPFCREHLNTHDQVIKFMAMQEAGVELTEEQQEAVDYFAGRFARYDPQGRFDRVPISEEDVERHVQRYLERMNKSDTNI